MSSVNHLSHSHQTPANYQQKTAFSTFRKIHTWWYYKTSILSSLSLSLSLFSNYFTFQLHNPSSMAATGFPESGFAALPLYLSLLQLLHLSAAQSVVKWLLLGSQKVDSSIDSTLFTHLFCALALSLLRLHRLILSLHSKKNPLHRRRLLLHGRPAHLFINSSIKL